MLPIIFLQFIKLFKKIHGVLKSNINVKIFDYEPKIYKNFRNHSYSYLSAIDVLFNFGKSSINIMNEAECSCHSLDFI